MARLGLLRYDTVWLGQVGQGGHGTERRDKVWSGLAGQGLVRLGPFRQGGRGPAWRGPV